MRWLPTWRRRGCWPCWPRSLSSLRALQIAFSRRALRRQPSLRTVDAPACSHNTLHPLHCSAHCFAQCWPMACTWLHSCTTALSDMIVLAFAARPWPAAVERIAARMRARAHMPCPTARRTPAAARALALAPARRPSSPPAFMRVSHLSPAFCPSGLPAADAGHAGPAAACPAVPTPRPLPWVAVRGLSPPQPRVT